MTRRFVSHSPKLARIAARAPELMAPPNPAPRAAKRRPPAAEGPAEGPKEWGGPSGPEPTRYGDWERKGICVDF